jgi:hypothetical protein
MAPFRSVEVTLFLVEALGNIVRRYLRLIYGLSACELFEYQVIVQAEIVNYLAKLV